MSEKEIQNKTDFIFVMAVQRNDNAYYPYFPMVIRKNEIKRVVAYDHKTAKSMISLRDHTDVYTMETPAEIFMMLIDYPSTETAKQVANKTSGYFNYTDTDILTLNGLYGVAKRRANSAQKVTCGGCVNEDMSHTKWPCAICSRLRPDLYELRRDKNE